MADLPAEACLPTGRLGEGRARNKKCRCGEIGIHATLKMLWEQSRVGSSPTSGNLKKTQGKIFLRLFCFYGIKGRRLQNI